MVSFEQHVIIPPATETFVNYAIHVFAIIGLLLSFSIALLALSLGILSYVLWARDHKQVIVHREHQRLDERKHE